MDNKEKEIEKESCHRGTTGMEEKESSGNFITEGVKVTETGESNTEACCKETPGIEKKESSGHVTIERAKVTETGLKETNTSGFSSRRFFHNPEDIEGVSSQTSEEVKTPSGQKRKSSADPESSSEKKSKTENTEKKALIYSNLNKLKLSEYKLRELDYPQPDPSGKDGHVLLYGDHFGFKKGHCKRCDKMFDTTFSTKTRCDFHMERSKRFNGRQQPHGCCGRRYGSNGCRTAPSHVYKGNLYMDLKGYKATEKKENPDYRVYAVDTESIHTKKGLEVCRVTVVDCHLKVVYNEICLPTTDVVDYNTIWSGISEHSLKGVSKTFEELREDMLKLFSADTLLIGHGLSHDLISMKIIHNNVIDTLVLYPHHRGWPLKRSLKDIALTELRMRIQEGEGHDSEEDAMVAMKLALRKIKPFLKQAY